MKTLRELRAVEISKDASEFCAMAKAIMAIGNGSFSQAAYRAEQKTSNMMGHGLSLRGMEILKHVAGGEISRAAIQKAAVGAVGLTSSPFADAGVIAAGFAQSLASAGVFDAMLSDMAQIPLMSGSVGSVNVGATGYVISQEGMMKPISKLSVTGAAQNPTKIHACLIVTQELAKSPLVAAGQLIQRELTSAMAIAADNFFISSITTNVVPATSFGTSASNARADIEYLLRITGLKANSKPYLVTTPAIARTLSQKENGGQPAFPSLGPLGGEVSPGLPLLISDAVPAGFLICIDASRIAAAGGEVILEELTEGVIEADDAPSSPPTGTSLLQSLWQLNLTGIRMERFMIATKLTTTAVAIINNPNNYVVGSGSP